MDIFTLPAQKINNADAVLVGASNGFSISEGLHLFACNQAFTQTFGDFMAKYGITNLLQGFTYSYPTQGEAWAFAARVAKKYSLGYTTSPVMEAFKTLVNKKANYIITSNGEGHFTMAGFNNLYEIEGSWRHMHCSRGCSNKLYPAFDALAAIAEAEKGTTPPQLIPKCPQCGAPMSLNLCIYNGFVPYEAAANGLNSFIQKYSSKNLVVLEMGIGPYNTLIKKPLMELVYSLPKATYITINKGQLYIPSRIAHKAYGLDGDLTQMLEGLCTACAQN